MTIDTHAHYLPQTSLDALSAGSRQFPSVELMTDGASVRLAFAGGEPTRPIMANLRGTEHRLRSRTRAVEVQARLLECGKRAQPLVVRSRLEADPTVSGRRTARPLSSRS